MKKITLEINSLIGNQGAKEISLALNNLSGVVAADVVLEDGMAYAYAGDMLQEYSASSAVRNAGFNCRIVQAEYFTDVEDYNKLI